MSKSQVVRLAAGGLKDLLLELEHDKGTLIIQSPERGVQVYMDGVLKGDFGTGVFREVLAAGVSWS